MKTLITGIKRVALALCLATPIVSWAATSTYSTYSDGTTTPSAGGAYSNHQRFQLNADWMFLADGTDVAASAVAVNLESIAVKWAGSTHGNADIGGNSNPQPDAYLVLTTPQDVIVGISAVNDAKWVANGTSIFAFTDVVVSPNAQYYFYFATDVSGLAVGAAMQSSNKKNGRVLCAYHGSDKASDETVRIGADNKYSINCSFVVSEASATAVTTGAEAVSLATGTDPVVVTGAVADGVVNVASGAEYPSVTVIGEATTLKLSDSITATYLYLPATTTIDASDVTLGLPGEGETTKETVLVSGKISSASSPSVTLPTVAEGYAIEPLVRDDSGITVVVTKPVDATVTLDGTEQKWSEVKPEGWVNSSVPVINIDNSVAGTLIFDDDVQAAKINITANYPVTFVRADGVNVNIPSLASPSYNLRAIFTNFDAIPQTAHTTDSGDQITANGTTTLTSFPQIGVATQSAKLILAQPATFTGSGIYVTGSKTIDINNGATVSTTRFVLGNNGNTTQTVNQNGGTITVTGTDGAGSTSASVLLGHWNSTSTFKTLGGTFSANNAASRLGWDGTTTWQIGGGESEARVNVYGIVNGQNGHTGSGTLNIMANGTLNLGAGGIQFSNSGNGGNINLAGGTIDTGAAEVTIANAKDGGTIINQNKTTTVNVDAEKTLTINAVLSGSGVGTLKKTGAGKLVLAKSATSIGKLLVNAGTVEFNDGVNWSTSGSVEVAANGTLNILTAEDVAEGELLRAGNYTVTGTVQNNGTPVDVEVKADGIYVKDPAVVKIGDTPYESLAAALAEVEAGQTITLAKDIALTEAVTVGASITIEGAHTISGSGMMLNVAAGETLTLTGGVNVSCQIGFLAATDTKVVAETGVTIGVWRPNGFTGAPNEAQANTPSEGWTTYTVSAYTTVAITKNNASVTDGNGDDVTAGYRTAGSTIEFYVTPEEGYELVSVTANSTPITPDGTGKYSVLVGDVTLTIAVTTQEIASDTYEITGETELVNGAMTVPAGTTTITLGAYDVTAGFDIDGTTATLLAPAVVEGETQKAVDVGATTVTLNVTLVPGLYYGVASGTEPTLSRPETLTQYTDDDSFLTVDKPSDEKGFFKVFVDIKDTDSVVE